MRIILFTIPVFFLSISDAFITPQHARFSRSNTAIFGAFNKRNKQADLMKKFEDAKKRREMNEAGLSEDEETKEITDTLSDREIKERNDRKRFEELLDRDTILGGGDDLSGTNYMTRKQEEENANASYKMSNRAFEGDPANDEVFRDLIYMKTGEALGKFGSERLLPWFNNKNSGKQKDFLVVVVDPRERSSELRSTMSTLAKLPVDLRSKTIVINADKPSDNRKILKKQKISSLDVYTDQGRAWMKEYTVLGEDRWTMTMLILSEGRIQKMVRDLDSELVGRVIRNAVDSL